VSESLCALPCKLLQCNVRCRSALVTRMPASIYPPLRWHIHTPLRTAAVTSKQASAMSNFFEAGSWVWIPDASEVVLPAKVVNSFYKGEPGKVLVDGKPRPLSPAESAECTRAEQQTLNPDVDNLTSLDDLNENRWVHALLAAAAAAWTKIVSCLCSAL
jgi:hypothetical protein